MTSYGCNSSLLDNRFLSDSVSSLNLLFLHVFVQVKWHSLARLVGSVTKATMVVSPLLAPVLVLPGIATADPCFALLEHRA